jgi:hypothetical protein
VDDKWFWMGMAFLLLVNIGMHRWVPGGVWFCFFLASYSAIANDSIQTLGTFIASNASVKWWIKWIWIGLIFNITILSSFLMHDGDITFERLKSKGFDKAPTELAYLQTAAPVVLLILTRLRIPVSTTFMLLTAYVGKPKALGKSIVKSMSGYAISFALSLVVYLPFGPAIKKYSETTKEEVPKYWVGI